MAREQPKFKLTDDGLHVTDSILWLDSATNGQLSFLSTAMKKTQICVPQVITTEETAKLLEVLKKKPNALVCQYNRPFSLGKLRIELLPSGNILGGASLLIETDRDKILYAPYLQPNAIPTVRKMQIKRAQSLIVGAYYPDSNTIFPNRKKEKERLLEKVRAYIAKDEYPIILCDPSSNAQEIIKLLCDSGCPVSVHPSIRRINKVYENYGSKLGRYSVFTKRNSSNKKVLILPKSLKVPFTHLKISHSPVFSIDDILHIGPNLRGFFATIPTRISETFFLSSYCDGPELRAIISLVSPKELYFIGPYAKKYCEDFQNAASKVQPLFVNDQPTLF